MYNIKCNNWYFCFDSMRQPKITAALDFEKDFKFDEVVRQNVSNYARNQLGLLKKSILLDGMINLTGKGARLAVIKATDATTGNSLGRIQARRADEVNQGKIYFLHHPVMLMIL